MKQEAGKVYRQEGFCVPVGGESDFFLFNGEAKLERQIKTHLEGKFALTKLLTKCLDSRTNVVEPKKHRQKTSCNEIGILFYYHGFSVGKEQSPPR